jgi:hypothetical protein
MSEDQFSVLVEHMHIAAERLIAALAQEERLGKLACKWPDRPHLYNEWAQARQKVEELQNAYDDAVACCCGGSRGGDRSEDKEQAAISKETSVTYSRYGNLK